MQSDKEEQDSQKRPCGIDADIGDQASATRHEQLMELVACGIENAECPAQCRDAKVSGRCYRFVFEIAPRAAYMQSQRINGKYAQNQVFREMCQLAHGVVDAFR